MTNYSHTLETKNIQLHYCDTDSFELCVNTSNITEDFWNLKYLFFNKEHKLFRKRNLKVFAKFEIESPNIFAVIIIYA